MHWYESDIFGGIYKSKVGYIRITDIIKGIMTKIMYEERTHVVLVV